jgi:hypothetical protein
MCTRQLTAATLNGWIQDPMIRLVMDSDGVSDRDMLALLQRVSAAVEARCDVPRLVEPY